jgi:hypothetical protein
MFALFDTTYSITYVTNTGYIYLELFLFWIVAALVLVMASRTENAI